MGVRSGRFCESQDLSMKDQPESHLSSILVPLLLERQRTCSLDQAHPCYPGNASRHCIKLGNLSMPRLLSHIDCPIHAILIYVQDLPAAIVCCLALPGRHWRVLFQRACLSPFFLTAVLVDCRAGPSVGFRSVHCEHVQLPLTSDKAEAWRSHEGQTKVCLMSHVDHLTPRQCLPEQFTIHGGRVLTICRTS